MVPETGSTAATKYDIEKFSGKNGFGLWQVKMRALLVQQGLVDVSKGEAQMFAELNQKQKVEILDQAHSTIILCLGDKALMEMAQETTIAVITTTKYLFK
ncbi:hypothetical protein TorRG33x02_236270 [Trema orientale]|uniref:Uncharacterized protein n=1 Tax=Trema orientale TaxID=63057 RepID=A0A2P5E1C0_TREOI|nr:hypothetical protein TorRG33x02_236270 [Trema orientale]